MNLHDSPAGPVDTRFHHTIWITHQTNWCPIHHDRHDSPSLVQGCLTRETPRTDSDSIYRTWYRHSSARHPEGPEVSYWMYYPNGIDGPHPLCPCCDIDPIDR